MTRVLNRHTAMSAESQSDTKWDTQGSEKKTIDIDVVAGTKLDPLEEPFPEGGFRAWSVVLGVWLVQFATLGYTNAHGVYNGRFMLLRVLLVTLKVASI
ncbi:hypothetical protein H0H81_001254 [Sphagnurus paluster]|uniref:Uncharacterized protein n=1 Tax=Sphagnurus paluster TaxID=117069 RepID=A0A9P7KKL8_9AGAR|nr:hypothetical protein H0H81_001254 [Sphagnurus paluster]